MEKTAINNERNAKFSQGLVDCIGDYGYTTQRAPATCSEYEIPTVPRRMPRLEDCLFIDVHQLTRQLQLKPGVTRKGVITIGLGNIAREARIIFQIEPDEDSPESLALTLTSLPRLDGTEFETKQKIELSPEPARFGGVYYLFRCPHPIAGDFCRLKSRRLYLPVYAEWFACRICLGLKYKSGLQSAQLARWLRKHSEEDLAQLKKAIESDNDEEKFRVLRQAGRRGGFRSTVAEQCQPESS